VKIQLPWLVNIFYDLHKAAVMAEVRNVEIYLSSIVMTR
jgi:hypothetical protein